jgi:hypothetical protein
MTYAAYLPMDSVDESASYTDMQGPSSMVNQVAGSPRWSSSPTYSLIALWVVVLAIYWALGYFFRGQRS